MRILNVIPWLAPRYGGPAVVQPQSASYLTALGHDVEFVTTNADGPGVLAVETRRPVQWAGATVTFHPLSHPRAFLTSWSLLADLRSRSRKFDVLHVHSLYRFHTIAAASVARRYGVPYVIQAHGALDPWQRARRGHWKDVYHWLIEDSDIRGAAVIVCTSEQEERSIRDLGYTVPTRIIPGGIDTGALREPASADGLLARLGVHPEARLVTFLGRISAKKGVDVLVESFRYTAQTFPDAHLVIAGPDDEGIGQDLEDAIAAAGLGGRVSFAGIVIGVEKRALLQRSNVFVLPSVEESFASAVAEAMAVGCPVVVTPHVALEKAVRSAHAGVVAERDPVEIAAAVSMILGDPASAAAMGEAGRYVADEQFAWPRVAAKLETMYEAVIASSSKRRARRST